MTFVPSHKNIFKFILGLNGNGHYLYFETSIPANQGVEVFFYSMEFPSPHPKFGCLSFNYSNYGTKGVASLKAVITHGDITDPTIERNEIFSTVTSSTDDGWHNVQVSINETSPFRVSTNNDVLFKSIRCTNNQL